MTYTGEEPPAAAEGTANAKWPWVAAALVVAAAIAVVVIVLTGGSPDTVGDQTAGRPSPTDAASAPRAAPTATEVPSATTKPTDALTVDPDGEVLYPNGFGAIKIGMSEVDAFATGALDPLETSSEKGSQCYTAARFTADSTTSAYFQHNEVVAINVARGPKLSTVPTLEGISIISTPADVMTAFPGLDLSPPRSTGVVPNYRDDGNNLVFATESGVFDSFGDTVSQVITSITLESPKATDCFE